MNRTRLATLLWAALLTSCVSHHEPKPAPILDKSHRSEHAFQESPRRVCQARPPIEFCHLVQRGDTLYSISRMHSLKVVEIASRNSIQAPFIIRPGDLLVVRQGSAVPAQRPVQQPKAIVTPQPRPSQRVIQQRTAQRPRVNQAVRPPPKVAQPTEKTLPLNPDKKVASTPQPKPASKPKPKSNAKPTPKKQIVKAKSGWQWPVPFTPLKSSENNALDYKLADGTEVVAAASGKVIYAGAGLNKYKHLIIVDTGSSHLVAYEFNTSHNIQEGESVQRGDRITRITGGAVDNSEETERRRQFHFEIWADGKPLNPRKVIGAPQGG